MATKISKLFREPNQIIKFCCKKYIRLGGEHTLTITEGYIRKLMVLEKQMNQRKSQIHCQTKTLPKSGLILTFASCRKSVFSLFSSMHIFENLFLTCDLYFDFVIAQKKQLKKGFINFDYL